MGIKKKILDAMDIFLGILREKTLQTLEEVDASTTDGYWAGAGAVAELNNKLAHGQIEFNINSDGEGFWKAAGADTWIPFKNSNIVYAFMCLSTHQIHTENVDLPIGTYKVNADGFCVTTSLMSSGHAYVTVNGVNYGNNQTFIVNKKTVGTVKLGQDGWENHGSIIITRLLAKIV